MRLIVIALDKPRTVVFHEDFMGFFDLAGSHGNMNRGFAFDQSVFDRVFDDWLKRKRWQAEGGVGRVEIHEEGVFELRLFDRQIGAGMLEFVRKGDEAPTGDGGEVLT